MHYHCEVLHMHRANASARRFYEHMGFADRPRAGYDERRRRACVCDAHAPLAAYRVPQRARVCDTVRP